jgi:hypothetical protein
VGPRTGLDDVERKKILPLPRLEISEPGWAVQSVACRYTDCATRLQLSLTHPLNVLKCLVSTGSVLVMFLASVVQDSVQYNPPV